MRSNFEGARRILLSNATTLEDIAAEVGLTAAELFDGVSFDGVDLTDEKADILSEINADYTNAILTRRQKKVLDNIPARKHQNQQKIIDIRTTEIRKFVEGTFLNEFHADAIQEMSRPFRSKQNYKGSLLEMHHSSAMVSFVVYEPIRLRLPLSETLKLLLITIKRMKIPISHKLLEVWPRESGLNTVLFQPNSLSEVIDFDYCTEKFVSEWLNVFDTALEYYAVDTSSQALDRQVIRQGSLFTTNSLDENDRRDAFRLAITAPSRLRSHYVEDVLRRVYRNEELRDLVAAIRPNVMDQNVSAAAARMLAKGATSWNAISNTLNDERIHTRIINAFRRLLVATNTTETRRALLETITNLGEQASGLEVDAIVSELSFQETMQTLRPYWNRLTPHHQNIARNALLGKATSVVERSQVLRL